MRIDLSARDCARLDKVADLLGCDPRDLAAAIVHEGLTALRQTPGVEPVRGGAAPEPETEFSVPLDVLRQEN